MPSTVPPSCCQPALTRTMQTHENLFPPPSRTHSNSPSSLPHGCTENQRGTGNANVSWSHSNGLAPSACTCLQREGVTAMHAYKCPLWVAEIWTGNTSFLHAQAGHMGITPTLLFMTPNSAPSEYPLSPVLSGHACDMNLQSTAQQNWEPLP